MKALPARLGLLAIAWLLSAGADRAGAIGWGPTDFLIGGGPDFTTKIGVFDSNLGFKGYLDVNFPTVAGMDFDAQGHLVAVATPSNGAVRVYDSSGAVVGGFIRNDNMLGTADDLTVAPNGDYIVATQNFGGGDGAREFAPDGMFVKQYGSGWITGAVVVPGNRLWTGGPGFSSINVFDLGSGMQLGTLSIPGVHGAFSMTYSAASNSVLIANYSSRALFETDLSGTVLQKLNATGADAEVATRGPNSDLFLTTGSNDSVLRWHADGTFVGATSTASNVGGTSGIVWAGNIPEPNTAALILITAAAMFTRRPVGRG